MMLSKQFLSQRQRLAFHADGFIVLPLEIVVFRKVVERLGVVQAFRTCHLFPDAQGEGAEPEGFVVVSDAGVIAGEVA